jgi:hypothetical protein
MFSFLCAEMFEKNGIFCNVRNMESPIYIYLHMPVSVHTFLYRNQLEAARAKLQFITL